MTEADKSPLNQGLDEIVDNLDEKIASEREAEGVPGKPSDRERAATEVSEGSEAEPPD